MTAYQTDTRRDGKVALILGHARGMGASHACNPVAQRATVFVGDILDDDHAIADEVRDAAIYVKVGFTNRGHRAQAVATGAGFITHGGETAGLAAGAMA